MIAKALAARTRAGAIRRVDAEQAYLAQVTAADAVAVDNGSSEAEQYHGKLAFMPGSQLSLDDR